MHAGLAVTICELSVKIVNGIKIHRYHHRDTAAVANAIVISVCMDVGVVLLTACQKQ
jgi:hypothetical protein